MPRILGIDPGSVNTGYGVVLQEGQKITHIAHGCIRLKGKTIPQRLHHLHDTLSALVHEHQPDEAAIEQVFVHINAQSALKLGQARGVAMVAMARYAIPISEYSAKAVKQTTTGYGAAAKSQIQFMIRSQLRLKTQPQEDAADALAVAICHCQHRTFLDKIPT